MCDGMKSKEESRPNSSKWIAEECEIRRTKDTKDDMKNCVTWSAGLEHESFLVHRKEGGREEYVVNTGTISTQVSRFSRAFGLSKKSHDVSKDIEATGVEYSGRSCAGMKDVVFKAMVESVTTGHELLSYDSGFCQIEVIDNHVLHVFSASPGEKRETKVLGPVVRPRTGMSSEIGVYTRTAGISYKHATCNDPSSPLKDYTGSYHISVSLPRDTSGWVLYDQESMTSPDTCNNEWTPRNDDSEEVDEEKRQVWVKAHMNFGNKFQWVEPLVLAVMGSSDAEAVCDNNMFVEGSYRTMAAGWGVPGTTDVRILLDEGVGRYAQTGFQWLLDAAPSENEGVFDCVDEGMGSDIRTKCDVEEHDLGPGESLPPMQVGQGVELRVFDNFPLVNFPQVFQFVSLLIESSRVHVASEYVYDNEDWANAGISAMKEGWNSILPIGYIEGLEDNLDIDLSGLEGSLMAFDVFTEVFHVLWSKHSNGFWTNLFMENMLVEPVLTNPNRESWNIGALNKEVSPEMILEVLDAEYGGVYYLADILDSDLCTGEDFEDLVYLAVTYGMVHTLGMNTDGSVEFVEFVGKFKDDVTYPTCSSA